MWRSGSHPSATTPTAPLEFCRGAAAAMASALGSTQAPSAARPALRRLPARMAAGPAATFQRRLARPATPATSRPSSSATSRDSEARAERAQRMMKRGRHDVPLASEMSFLEVRPISRPVIEDYARQLTDVLEWSRGLQTSVKLEPSELMSARVGNLVVETKVMSWLRRFTNEAIGVLLILYMDKNYFDGQYRHPISQKCGCCLFVAKCLGLTTRRGGLGPGVA